MKISKTHHRTKKGVVKRNPTKKPKSWRVVTKDYVMGGPNVFDLKFFGDRKSAEVEVQKRKMGYIRDIKKGASSDMITFEAEEISSGFTLGVNFDSSITAQNIKDCEEDMKKDGIKPTDEEAYEDYGIQGF